MAKQKQLETLAGKFGENHGTSLGPISEENVRRTFEEALATLKKDGLELTDMLIILVGQNDEKREVRGGMAGNPKYLLKAAIQSAASFEDNLTGGNDYETDSEVH